MDASNASSTKSPLSQGTSSNIGGLTHDAPSERLEIVSLLLSGEKHKEMDKRVTKDLMLWRIPRNEIDNYDLPLVLSSIVRSAEQDCGLDQTYANIDEADSLIKRDGRLVDELKDAWMSESFERIRSLQILQGGPRALTTPPSSTVPLASGNPISPPKTNQDVDTDIEDFMRRIRVTLQNFLRSRQPLPHWKPPGTEPDDASHIRDLEIPSLNGPVLLLHDLGNMAEDVRVLDLFNRTREGSAEHTLLYNTSGSGKTRLILEGLLKHWGLYFVCQVDSSGIGSNDLAYLIDYGLRQARGWTENLPSNTDSDFANAVSTNVSIATRCLHQILLARLLVFRLFLETAKEMYGKLTDEHKRLWLLLQVAPTVALSPHPDVFDSLAWATLEGAAEAHVPSLIRSTFRDIVDLLEGQLPANNLFCVIDEAQVAAVRSSSAFRSSDMIHARPILWEIVQVWSGIRNELRFIVTGTGGFIQIVNDAVESAMGKPGKWRTFCDTGAFADSDSQEKYVRRYIPNHIIETESGQQLLSRLRHWLHGRYRFTAAYIRLLLCNRWKSPHRLLDEYVHHYTGYRPTDGPTALEEDISTVTRETLECLSVTFNFEALAKQSHLVHQAYRIVFRHLTRREPLLEAAEEMVEIGFARFLRDSALVDEHLSILSLAQWLETRKGFTFETFLSTRLQQKVIWEPFEDAISYYLSRAFALDTFLTEIFEFHGDPPAWATQGAELITFTRNQRGEYQWASVNLLSRKPSAAGSSMVIPCESWEDVLKWLNDQEYIPICSPHSHMGPDLICLLRLADGRMLWLVVQAKCWRTALHLPTKTVADAIDSVTPSKFFSRNPVAASHITAALKALPEQVKMSSDVPLLRVLAAWPSTTGATSYADLDEHPLATLREDKFLQSLSTGILAALGRKFEGQWEKKRVVNEAYVAQDREDSAEYSRDNPRRPARKRTRVT